MNLEDEMRRYLDPDGELSSFPDLAKATVNQEGRRLNIRFQKTSQPYFSTVQYDFFVNDEKIGNFEIGRVLASARGSPKKADAEITELDVSEINPAPGTEDVEAYRTGLRELTEEFDAYRNGDSLMREWQFDRTFDHRLNELQSLRSQIEHPTVAEGICAGNPVNRPRRYSVPNWIASASNTRRRKFRRGPAPIRANQIFC